VSSAPRHNGAVLRALAVAHILIAVLLMPLTLAGGLVAPLLLAGPVWGAVLGVGMWQRRPGVGRTLRRTHGVYLVVDALLIAYGVWALRAAAESAARGGGLLGGIGLIPIVIGASLATFSAVVLLLTWRQS
jgi:hypothetical protein